MAVDTPPVPRTRRFTADEVWRMVDAGIIGQDERLELIDGELCLVTPAGWDHVWVVGEIGRRLAIAYGLKNHLIHIQSTVGGSEHYLPEPDVAVRPARGPWTDERRHPRADECLLVVEVAASSQRLDQRKVRLYAEAGAPVYWIVDIPSRSAIVHEGPRRDGTWERVDRVADAGEVAVPRTDVTVPLAELLPPPG